MLILGIETSGRRGSVALCAEGGTIARHRFAEGPRNARHIMPAIDDIVRDSGTEKTDIDAVGVSEGPGSFTGLRVGVTCAKTLAYSLGWDAVGVPSLEVLVQNLTGGTLACPLRDARRSCVYADVFERRDGRWVDRTGVMLGRPQGIARRIPPGTVIFGSGRKAYPDIFAQSTDKNWKTAPAGTGEGRAEAVASVALRILAEKGATPPMELVPKYHRKTAAETNVENRNS